MLVLALAGRADEAAAAKLIEELGGRVVGKPVVEVDCSGTRKFTDSELKQLKVLKSLEVLNLRYTQVTDFGLSGLKELKGLRTLKLGYTKVTDAGLKELKELKRLDTLGLGSTQVADAGLKELKELRFGCTSLGVGIEGTRFTTVSAMSVTQPWLEQMKSLKKLERLKLQGCDRVDDEAAKLLAAFPMLREIDLKGTAVTEKGVAALRAAKPKAQIYFGPWEGRAANFRNN